MSEAVDRIRNAIQQRGFRDDTDTPTLALIEVVSLLEKQHDIIGELVALLRERPA